MYARTDEHELLSGLSSPKFINFLKSIPGSEKNKSLFNNIIDSILRVLRFIGLAPKEKTLYDKVYNVVETMIYNPISYKAIFPNSIDMTDGRVDNFKYRSPVTDRIAEEVKKLCK